MTARQCGWCGHTTNDYLVHDLETDHGPSSVVWCRDWRACRAARAARPPQAATPTRNRRR